MSKRTYPEKSFSIGVTEILRADEKALKQSDKTRALHINGIVLGELVEKMPDMSKDWNNLLDTKMGRREMFDSIHVLITNAIVSLSREYLAVKEYLQHSGSRQQIYLFLGTHWREIAPQQFYDFVRDCCIRMKVPPIYVMLADFMNRVVENVACNLAHHRESNIPSDDVWINLKNGTLEMHEDGTMLFREHRAEDFFTYCLNYCYNPLEDCKLWKQFLNEILPQKDVQELLAEYIGYCFTHNMKLEKMAVFYGMGSNGKSVVLDMICALLGSENISNISLNALTQDAEKRGHIDGKLANISHESGGNLDTAMLKQLVSGEPTEYRKLYVGTRRMTQYAKLFTSYNKLPRTEQTFGFFRRWLLFPFSVTIREDQQDHDLTKKLMKELSGILNWVLVGMSKLMQNRAFSASPTCDEALAKYKLKSNSVLLFLDENCEEDNDSRTTLKQLYNAYNMFCLDGGISNRFTKSNFREMLESIGAKMTMYNHQITFNIKIKAESDLL